MRRATVVSALAVSLLLGACTSDDDALDDDVASTEQEVTPPPVPNVATYPTESWDEFPNPERGMYVGYNLLAAGDATSIRTAGYTLVMAEVNLQDYRDKSLDSAILTKLTNGFAKVRAAGLKVILRFTYNNSYAADATESRILGHITQLSPILHDNADVIAVWQAGFIGAWGEWHSSTNNLTTDTIRGDILHAELAAIPSSRSVQVRTPMYKNAYRAGATTTAEAYTGSSRSRLGHHNDCFLASASDMGTYASPTTTWTDYTHADSAFVPVGGETCALYAARTDCTPAKAELAKMHWSYLNKEYNGTVLGAWQTQGCYSTIKMNLGYRFVATRVAVSQSVSPGGVLALQVDIKNKGYAVPFNAHNLQAVLISSTGARLVAPLSFDVRRLYAGATTTISTYLRIPANLATGTYKLALRIADPYSRLANDNRYSIRLANTGVWNATTGDNVLTTNVVVNSSTAGDRDSTATTFVELH
jgi:hypothetical protein